jgi:hypothetical protein
MKTAMQELIDEMTKYLDLHESPEVKEVLRILKASAIRKYWKKEKEQITKAYNSAIPFKFGEEYYNQTYNQEETLEEWKSKFTHHCVIKANQNK